MTVDQTVDKRSRMCIMSRMVGYSIKQIAHVLLVCSALTLFSCANAKEQVRQSLTAAQTDVATIKSLAKDNLSAVGELNTTPATVGIKSRSEAQIKIADKLITDLQCVGDTVENKLKNTSPIRDFFNRMGFILMVVVVIGACVYFGIGSIIRPLLSRIGLWITPIVRQEAKADAEFVIERGGIKGVDPQQVKRIATRQTSADYAKAFKQEINKETGANK